MRLLHVKLLLSLLLIENLLLKISVVTLHMWLLLGLLANCLFENGKDLVEHLHDVLRFFASLVKLTFETLLCLSQQGVQLAVFILQLSNLIFCISHVAATVEVLLRDLLINYYLGILLLSWMMGDYSKSCDSIVLSYLDKVVRVLDALAQINPRCDCLVASSSVANLLIHALILSRELLIEARVWRLDIAAPLIVEILIINCKVCRVLYRLTLDTCPCATKHGLIKATWYYLGGWAHWLLVSESIWVGCNCPSMDASMISGWAIYKGALFRIAKSNRRYAWDIDLALHLLLWVTHHCIQVIYSAHLTLELLLSQLTRGLSVIVRTSRQRCLLLLLSQELGMLAVYDSDTRTFYKWASACLVASDSITLMLTMTLTAVNVRETSNLFSIRCGTAIKCASHRRSSIVLILRAIIIVISSSVLILLLSCILLLIILCLGKWIRSVVMSLHLLIESGGLEMIGLRVLLRMGGDLRVSLRAH